MRKSMPSPTKKPRRETPREMPPGPPPRKEQSTIELHDEDLIEDPVLIEVGERVVEPGRVIVIETAKQGADHLFFDWAPEALVSIGERTLAD